MRLRSLFIAFATTALTCLALPVLAQDKTGPNVDSTATGTKGGTAQLLMAQELYGLGMAGKDALTVLTAARLAGGVDLKDVARTPRTEGPEIPEEADIADAPVSAATMFASARDLAGEDETLIGLIDDAETEGSHGRVGGASGTLSRLAAGRSDVWELPFYGASYAEVAVIGDGDADLDVLIADEGGNSICSDNSYSDKVYCDFVPAWNGYFYVTVVNNGSRRNSYYLVTN